MGEVRFNITEIKAIQPMFSLNLT